jgi:hypothetical protein
VKTIDKTFKVTISQNAEPAWASKIDRWFQLDSDSNAICSALDIWLQHTEVNTSPHLILQASTFGSHIADIDFVRCGSESPAKFVYTLPNVVVGVLAQFLSWKGPTFNFTGTESWVQAERFAHQWLNTNHERKHEESSLIKPCALIFQIGHDPNSNQFRHVRLKQLEKTYAWT